MVQQSSETWFFHLDLDVLPTQRVGGLATPDVIAMCVVTPDTTCAGISSGRIS